MVKLKVSTNSSDKVKDNEKRVMALLQDSEGIYPKRLAFMLKINVNTIKSMLKRLELRGLVRRKSGLRGLYELVETNTHGVIFDWKFHNTSLNYLLPEYKGERVDETFEFGVVEYHFEIGKGSKQATIRIATKYPANISSICIYFAHFSLLVNKYTGFTPKQEEVNVSCIEFNQDYSNLRLEGVNCITLGDLISQFKIYNKPEGLRVEHRVNIPINLEAIMNLLNNKFLYPMISNEIFSMRDNQKIIIEGLKRNNDLLGAILNRLSQINSSKLIRDGKGIK